MGRYKHEFTYIPEIIPFAKLSNEGDEWRKRFLECVALCKYTYPIEVTSGDEEPQIVSNYANK